MATILFYESTDPTQLVVAAYDNGARSWQHQLAKQELAAWLKQRLRDEHLQKDDVWVAVIAEDDIVRRIITMPPQLHGRERSGMVENALTVAMGEKPTMVGMQRMTLLDDGQEQWAVAGVRTNSGAQWLKWFGIWARRVRFVGAAECCLLFAPQAIANGYYAIEAPLWSAVIAIKDGVVAEGRAAQGSDVTTLHYELMEATNTLLLPPMCLPWLHGGAADFSETLLNTCCFIKGRSNLGVSHSIDRKMVALILGCVIVPGLLWLGLQGRALPPEEVADTTPQAHTVARSTYSTLVAEAYQAKSARITLLSHEAAEGALSIHGRCSEALDLADYMRKLESAEQSLHPVLLDLSKKTEKDRYYYEFVVQISLEGRDMP